MISCCRCRRTLNWHQRASMRTICTVDKRSPSQWIHSKQECILHRTILVTITLQLSLLLPTLMRLMFRYYMKEPYHTSILSGYAWLQELLHGHPERIRTELGVHKEVFHALIQELQSMGHGGSKYTSVTGLSTRHVGERFQQANGTISK